MSLLLDYQTAEIASFGGPDLLSDASIVDRGHALKAQNVEYSAGSVGTRHGYAGVNALQTVSGSIFSMHNWIGPFSRLVATWADSAIVESHSAGGFTRTSVANLNTTTSSGLMYSQLYGAASGASHAGVGLRLYQALFDSAQQSAGNPVSVSILTAGATIATNLFAGPSTAVPTTSEPGAGLVTAGAHRVGYLVEFVNGFTTAASPSTVVAFAASGFSPISVTATGSKNLRVAFGLAWNTFHASYLSMLAVSVIMTTTTNLNQYYVVPGSRTLLSAVGSTAAVNIDVSVSDSDLSSQGVDATPYLYWLTLGANDSTTDGGGFGVRHLCLLGDRMGYLGAQSNGGGGTIDALYVSERSSYQSVTADQHVLQLPGQRPMTTAFRMGSVNYICGPHEIWATADNGDVPVSWAAPQLIDGRHGTQAIHGVEVAPSGNYAWLADQGGLYLFTGGPITSLPVSYRQSPDWNRINWGSACCIKVRDDAGNKRVHAMVPLDGATTPSHIMTWDYTNGATPDAVMYSLESLSGYPLGAMALVRNDLLNQATGNAGKVELWLGSSTTGKLMLRQTSDADFRSFTRAASTLTNIIVTTNTAVATVSAAHGLHVGQSIVVAGATVDTDLNGTYAITAVTSTTFTFTTANVTGAPTTYTESTLGITVSPYQDNGAAISSVYRTCPLPGRGISQGHIQMHHGFHARLKGAGTIGPTVYDIDAVRSFPCSAQALSTTPDMDTLVLARMRNELAFAEFSQGTVNQYWVLSYLKWYFSEYLMQR